MKFNQYIFNKIISIDITNLINLYSNVFYVCFLYYIQANDNQVENYPVLVNPEGPLYSKAVGIRFKV
jgi:hypothetical protein